MSKTTVDISGFNRGLTGFVDKLGLSGQVVLKKEMGELVKTLVKSTPGADPEKLRKNISFKFDAIGDSNNSWSRNGHGLGETNGIEWYSVDSRFLYGIAEQNDKRDASVDDLKKLLYTITKSGHRLNVPIKGHKTQRALISQTILTKVSTVKETHRSQAQESRRRLKAGWMAAVFSGALQLTSAATSRRNGVTRHRTGVRGYFLNGLGVKNFPTFTIANTAAGVGNSKLNLDWLVQKALTIRAKAMKTNLTLFMRGKKNLSDYA